MAGAGFGRHKLLYWKNERNLLLVLVGTRTAATDVDMSTSTGCCKGDGGVIFLLVRTCFAFGWGGLGAVQPGRRCLADLSLLVTLRPADVTKVNLTMEPHTHLDHEPKR